MMPTKKLRNCAGEEVGGGVRGGEPQPGDPDHGDQPVRLHLPLCRIHNSHSGKGAWMWENIY